MKTLIINLFGGPGCGKSTICAGIFHELKLLGVNCEMALEFAKDLVWQDTSQLLDNQFYVFGEQYHRIWRLLGKVDIVICDSPLLNSVLYYKGENPHFPRAVVEEHKRLSNLNIVLDRAKPYNPSGRLHTEKEARSLDGRIVNILDFLQEDHFTYTAEKGVSGEIAKFALDAITPFGADIA